MQKVWFVRATWKDNIKTHSGWSGFVFCKSEIEKTIKHFAPDNWVGPDPEISVGETVVDWLEGEDLKYCIEELIAEIRWLTSQLEIDLLRGRKSKIKLLEKYRNLGRYIFNMLEEREKCMICGK